MLLFVPSAPYLALALQLGGGAYSWNDSRAIGSLVVVGMLLLFYLISQTSGNGMVGGRATIPLHLLKEGSCTGSCTGIFGGVFTRVTQFMSLIPGLESYRYACFLFK